MAFEVLKESDCKIKKIQDQVEFNIINNKLIKSGDSIVVAVSGGPDSMCLLTILYELKSKFKEVHNIEYNLVVAHVNHGFRKESDDEKIYVEEFCKKLLIPFFYLKEDVPKKALEMKMSHETCSRKIRYDFFDEILSDTNSNKIAVAHNLDDNVETIILNIIRGTGLKGLTGMGYSFKNIIRPLISIEKKDILEYNVLKNLNPCFDKTNEQDIYTRNKIRLNLIPYLKEEYNPNILSSINRMKQIVELDEDFLDNYTDKVLKNCIINSNKTNIRFDFSNILNEHKAIQSRVIRKLIELQIGDLNEIANIHILDILKLFETNIKGKKYIIGNKFTIENISKNIAVIYNNK